MGNQRKSRNYDEFVDKFKHRHTTDDCFTPPNVYQVVLDWAAKKYGFDPSCVVRPFCPDGDYQAFDYAPDAVVVDNPPFSIISKIVKWYNDHGIRFFLFAPGMTLLGNVNDKRTCAVIASVKITYDNGAIVSTGFLTNLSDNLIETCPDLHDLLFEANKIGVKKSHQEKNRIKPRFKYPDSVMTIGRAKFLTDHHVELRVKREDAVPITKLDCMDGNDIFSTGYMLSKSAEIENANAYAKALSNREKETSERIKRIKILTLSPREKELQRRIGK